MRRRISPADRVLRDVAESDFQDDIVEKATWLGFRVFHVYDSRKSIGEGFPDLVMVKPPRLLFVELKRETGTVSPKQLEWLGALMMCPQVEVHVWKPRDTDAALRVLEGKIG